MKTKGSEVLTQIDIGRSPDQILSDQRAKIDRDIAWYQKVIELTKRIDASWWLTIERKIGEQLTPACLASAALAWMIFSFGLWGTTVRKAAVPWLSSSGIIAGAFTLLFLMVQTRKYWIPSFILFRRLKALGVTHNLAAPSDRKEYREFCRSQIAELERRRDGLTLESTVPPLYLEAIARIRAKTVGPDSNLQKARIRTDERAQELSAQANQMQMRMKDALAKNERSRMPSLESACEKLTRRVRAFTDTVAETNDLTAGITAILNECEARAKGLGGQLGDVDLIRKMEAGDASDEALLDQARTAMEETVAEIREKVINLHEAIAAAASSPDLAGKEESLDEYLERVEAANEEVAKLLTTTLLTT